MRLTLESLLMDDVVVIRCKGRICFGAEVDALEAKVTEDTKISGTDIYHIRHVVLDLGETEYIDSSGLGALVRLYGRLRAVGGGLNLCQPSPVVLKTLEVTNLNTLFPPYTSAAEAIQAFSDTPKRDEPYGSSKDRIVCVDTSNDLLAGLSALLRAAGYEVFTTRYVGEAATLVNATRPKVVICGPGMMAVPTGPAVIEKFRKSGADLQILHLPPDYHTAEAGQAGLNLTAQVRSLLGN